MSSQKRKPANAKPITSNPLFPAVVALWFGAAFGLGSLAVRPSLLEELVLKSHIDLIIPAAAPPLGVTARILLALIMAALGATLGIMLSRRLTRPKPEVYERKRGAKDLAATMPNVRSRDAHPDAPARRPISAHEELGGEPPLEDDRAPAVGPGMLANRRRALAIIHEEPAFVPHDHAPLPGGAALQPLDLAALALSADPLPHSSPAAPLAAAPVPTTMPTAEPEPISAEAAHRDGRQVFGMAPSEPQPAAPRQIFGVVAEDDHLPQDFVKAAGFQTSVFDTAEPSPLFDRAPQAPAAGLSTASEPRPQFTSDPVAAPVAAMPEPSPAIVAAQTQPLPSPASLGMTDLAARLAESMRRRRAAQTQASMAQAPVAPAEPDEAEAAIDEALPQQVPQAPLSAMPTAFAPPSPADPVPVLAQFTAATSAVAQPNFSAPLTMPAAMRPLALDAFLEDDAPFDGASLLPPRHIAMPTAAPPQPADFAPPFADQPAGAHDERQPGEDESVSEDSADNPYASLLAVAPARQAFVRIDEPDADAFQAIEPVVIFPGQIAHVTPLAAAQPAPGEDNGFRRFDAPASAGQGQPVAANTAAAPVDPVEAAQALRAALSNLQRMSGAA